MSKSSNMTIVRDVQPGDGTRYTYTCTTMEVTGYSRPLSRITVNVGGFGDFGRFESIVINGNSDRINYIGCAADSYTGKTLAFIAASHGIVGEMSPEWAVYARDKGAEGFWWLGEIGMRMRSFSRSTDASRAAAQGGE